jgi:hypothetical protein
VLKKGVEKRKGKWGRCGEGRGLLQAKGERKSSKPLPSLERD